MKRVLLPILIASAPAFALTGFGAASQEPVFRAVGVGVTVSVSVRDKNRPIGGLKTTDFELLDNGVPQEITSSSAETQPVDVTLVLDISGSVRGAVLDKMKADIQQMADLLEISDRIRLLSFDVTVSDVFGLQPGGTPLPLQRIAGGGLTSFYHGIAAALMMVPDADRPQLVFGFSDGLDNTSFLDVRKLAAVADYSSATLYLALVPSRGAHVSYSLSGGTAVYRAGAVPNRGQLTEVATRTGGLVYDEPSSVPSTFQKVLADFRTSYVLRYIPRGVPREGWHEIAVKLKVPKNYDVRARKGYQG